MKLIVCALVAFVTTVLRKYSCGLRQQDVFMM
jgi:hypothetical protein